MTVENDDTTKGSINAFKDALLLTITKLNDMIDFLKGELEEKKPSSKNLINKGNKDGDKIEPSLLCPWASEVSSNSGVESPICNTSSGDDNVTQDNENYYDSNRNGEEQSIEHFALNSTLITIDKEINTLCHYISTEDTSMTFLILVKTTVIMKASNNKYKTIDT